MNFNQSVLDHVPAQQKARAHGSDPRTKRSGPSNNQDGPPAKRARPEPAAPAPPAADQPESNSDSDDDDDDYLPRAKRARPSAAAPAPAAAAPERETRTGLVSRGHAVHWPAIAAFERLPVMPCMRVTARQS